jgi:hypothetical protein
MDQNLDIYAKAANELLSIDGQIAALEKRRAALRQFVDLGQRLYADIGSDAAGRLPPGADVVSSVASMGVMGFAERMRNNRENSLKARVLALSKQAIQEAGPRSTRELLAYIEAAGVEVTGADKPTTVSVILSRSDDFKADRNVGWTLVDPQKELTPQDAPTSAGSSTA